MPILRVVPTAFEMFSGNTKQIDITVLDEDSVAVDLTGGSAKFTVSDKANTSELFSKVGVLPGSPSNLIEYTIAPADTESLAGVYYWEAEFTDVSGRISTIAYGSLTIRINNS